MRIGKLIKTGLMIYGGYTLAEKAGVYLFKKYKDKIVEKVRNKVLELSNKAIDEIFHTEKRENLHFVGSDIWFSDVDKAYDARQKMIDRIHDFGNATVADFKAMANVKIDFIDTEFGWNDPMDFETAYVERTFDSERRPWYYISCAFPEKLYKED